jgi:hypothetical protein
MGKLITQERSGGWSLEDVFMSEVQWQKSEVGAGNPFLQTIGTHLWGLTVLVLTIQAQVCGLPTLLLFL